MHELAVTEQILQTTLRYASRNNATTVTHIHLILGQLSGFVDESIQFYWDIIAKETIARNAVITIKRQHGTLTCGRCGQSIRLTSMIDRCPSCDSFKLSITSGSELLIDYIEIE